MTILQQLSTFRLKLQKDPSACMHMHVIVQFCFIFFKWTIAVECKILRPSTRLGIDTLWCEFCFRSISIV